MSKDIIIYVHCPEIIESPLHSNEEEIIEGILRDICDIIKYSFLINDSRNIIYFGRKIDLDYKIEKSSEDINTVLKYSFIINNRDILCECNITKVLNDLNNEKAFLNDYVNLIKYIVKDIGKKATSIVNISSISIRFSDLKRHYLK